jgi:hypothetical protein
MTGHERMHLEWSWSHTPKTGHEQWNLRLVMSAYAQDWSLGLGLM